MRLIFPLLLLALGSAPVFAAGADSLLARSKAAESRGESDKAIRLAQSAVVTDPARASSYTALGDLYARSGEAGYAAYYYGEALAIDPLEPEAQKGLARADRAAEQAAAARSLDKP